MIYLLTAVGLSPGGSTHLHTNNTQNNTNNNQTTQITINVEECGPCPVFARFALVCALQLRKKHGKNSVRVRKTCQVKKNLSQSTVYILPKHPHITKPTQTHTLQNSLKQPQYKLKQTQCKIYPNEITYRIVSGSGVSVSNRILLQVYCTVHHYRQIACYELQYAVLVCAVIECRVCFGEIITNF